MTINKPDLTVLLELEARLKACAGLSVVVGVPESKDTTLESGISMVKLAFTHEFGATIDMPARSQSVYREVDSSGDFKNSGRFTKRSKSNFSSSHDVAAHTIVIPERSFLRSSMNENQQKYAALMAAQTKKVVMNGADPKSAYALVGEVAAADVKNKITNGNFTPLKPATIKRKGSSKPLVDEGQLRQWISSEVRVSNE